MSFDNLPVDNVTIKQKSFGRAGIPLDPLGGIYEDVAGMYLKPWGIDHFEAGIPRLTLGGNSTSSGGTVKYYPVLGQSKKQGLMVSFELIWRYSSVWSPGGQGILEFTLPYDAESLYGKIWGRGYLIDVTGNIYPRKIALTTALQGRLVTENYTTLSDTSPVTMGDGDEVVIQGEYYASATAQYRWSDYLGF